MDQSLKELLDKGIEQIDSQLLDEKLSKKLQRLYDEISLFNPSYGLVNAEGQELVVKHILDCLAPVPILVRQANFDSINMADLGSGSGLPGLVLASSLPQWKITLVERMGRRVGFLRNTIPLMGLASQVSVLQKDLSEVQNYYNVITFRAFRAFKDIICDLDRILIPGGKIFAYKSSEENINDELEVINAYKACKFDTQVIDYTVPMLDAKRRMLIVTKQV
ncbi:MAG: 16S rRNA (guanine(527)-N(7))-methyltransferase RsmG [Sphaerochaetaceae bacterium]|nr:16S rRNA (guanine(527)-N(7))-methyltransferase RsmG [Sphaerochaetaceae bacterium]